MRVPGRREEGEKGGGGEGRRRRREEGEKGEGVPHPQHMEPLNIKHSTISVRMLLQDPNMFSKWL